MADVDALVAELGAKEDGNFRLFGYVGEVNASVETLRGRMCEVSAEVERWHGANAAKDSNLSRSLQVSWGPELLRAAQLWLGESRGACNKAVMQAPAILLRQTRPEQPWSCGVMYEGTDFAQHCGHAGNPQGSHPHKRRLPSCPER